MEKNTTVTKKETDETVSNQENTKKAGTASTDKLKTAKVNFTKQTEDLKNAFKADKTKFTEAKSESSDALKTKITSLKKSNDDVLKKLDANYANAVQSSSEKLEKENVKKTAKLEKLELDHSKVLEVPTGVIQEYKNFQIEADKNENERHSKITAAHKAANKKAFSDANKHEANLKNIFAKDTSEFNLAIVSLDNRYAEDQKEQTAKTNKLLSEIKSASTKVQNKLNKEIQSLTEEYNSKKTELDTQLADAGSNKVVSSQLKKEITLLTKTYNANMKEVNEKLSLEKSSFEKETLTENQANNKVMEELRINYINDKIKLEKELKEKELRLETDLLNSERAKVSIEANTELSLLSDENRLQILLHKLTFEMQESKILEHHGNVIAAFELNKAIVELDNELLEIETKFTLAKSELENELKKKQDSIKLALEIQKLEYTQDTKFLDDKLKLDTKEVKMNFELSKKANEFKALEFQLKGEQSQENTDALEEEVKSFTKTFELENTKLQSEYKKAIAALNSKNALEKTKLENELIAFEKEINNKIAQAENTKAKELKANENKRSAAQATHDKTVVNAETAKFEKYEKFKLLIDEMQKAQNALANEILAMTSKELKIRNSQANEIAKNEATFQKKLKENAASFEKKRKSLIASKKI